MKWFEIKPETEGVVKLDPKTRKGELTFKVTNVSGKVLRAGAVVFPQEDEQRAWTSIKGEAIQEMGEDTEKTFKVGVAAPREVAPGTYSITFVVCNEANPEEETAELKAEFKIDTPAEQAVSRVRQYRWYYLTAALAVGIVGLIVWWFWPGRKARFSVDRREGPAYLIVQFMDESRGKPHSWLWDFGDGYTSDEQDPIHFYADPNGYAVSLTINGKKSTKTTKKNYIKVKEPEVRADFEICNAAAFGIREATAYVGDKVFFHNLSTGESSKPEEPNESPWEWAFGDSGSSSEEDPNHTYENEGTYEVQLQVSGGKDRAIGTVRILERINLDFGHKRVYAAAEPYAVQFTDKSTPEPQSWKWEFGDGSTSDERNPIHFYENPNPWYTVTLTVSGEVQAPCSVTKQVDFKEDELIAMFSCHPQQGKAPLRVYFNDLSLGSPNSWDWSFKNIASNKDNSAMDESSEDQDPINYFEDPGIYDVTLTSGRGKEEKEDTISVSKCIKVTKEAMPPVAEFTVRRALSESGAVYVPTYRARFTYAKKDKADPNSGKAIDPVPSIPIQRGDTVEFMDLSKGDVKSWRWNFGDDTPVSEERDPKHIFNRVGDFTVSLTVTGLEGTDPNEMLKPKFVQVSRKTKVETIEPNEIPNMEVYPQRLFKGSDFDGPRAEFNVTATLKKEDRHVNAYLSMYVMKKPKRKNGGDRNESKKDVDQNESTKDDGLNMVDPNMVVAKGIVTKRIFTAPEGWKVNRIITAPTSLFWAGIDEAPRADYEEKKMSWCEFAVMADTAGDDIGKKEKYESQTHMIVQIIEPIKIELIEE